MRSLVEYFVSGVIADVSTSGGVYLPIPDAGNVKKIFIALNGALTGSDEVFTAKVDGTAMTNGAVTAAQATSTVGSVYTITPSAGNHVTEGGTFEIETSGASGTARVAHISAVIDR